MISYFSGKSLTLVPWESLISAQNAFGGRAPPRPAGGAHSAPPDSLAGFKGKGGGNFVYRFGEIEAPAVVCLENAASFSQFSHCHFSSQHE